MTVKEWESEIELLSKKECEEYHEAFSKILEWEIFKEHFDWTGLSEIKLLLKSQVDINK